MSNVFSDDSVQVEDERKIEAESVIETFLSHDDDDIAWCKDVVEGIADTIQRTRMCSENQLTALKNLLRRVEK